MPETWRTVFIMVRRGTVLASGVVVANALHDDGGDTIPPAGYALHDDVEAALHHRPQHNLLRKMVKSRGPAGRSVRVAEGMERRAAEKVG